MISEHEIDIVLEFCAPVIQVSEAGNGAGRTLNLAVHSDKDKSGSMCCPLRVPA